MHGNYLYEFHPGPRLIELAKAESGTRQGLIECTTCNGRGIVINVPYAGDFEPAGKVLCPACHGKMRIQAAAPVDKPGSGTDISSPGSVTLSAEDADEVRNTLAAVKGAIERNYAIDWNWVDEALAILTKGATGTEMPEPPIAPQADRADALLQAEKVKQLLRQAVSCLDINDMGNAGPKANTLGAFENIRLAERIVSGEPEGK